MRVRACVDLREYQAREHDVVLERDADKIVFDEDDTVIDFKDMGDNGASPLC